MLRQVLDNGRVVTDEVDVTRLGVQDKKVLMENILKVVEDDNEKFLRRLRDRTDRFETEAKLTLSNKPKVFYFFSFNFVLIWNLGFSTGWGLRFRRLKSDMSICRLKEMCMLGAEHCLLCLMPP